MLILAIIPIIPRFMWFCNSIFLYDLIFSCKQFYGFVVSCYLSLMLPLPLVLFLVEVAVELRVQGVYQRLHLAARGWLHPPRLPELFLQKLHLLLGLASQLLLTRVKLPLELCCKGSFDWLLFCCYCLGLGQLHSKNRSHFKSYCSTILNLK